MTRIYCVMSKLYHSLEWYTRV